METSTPADILNSTILSEYSSQVHFSWYDYVFFVGLLGVSAAIGIYFGCFGDKQSSAKEYLLGGKSMKFFPIAMSLTASHVSGITLLGVPADVYTFGASYALGSFCYIIMVVITSYVYLPVYFKLQITSTYEYLERRFDNKTRVLASFMCALSIFLFLPIVIYIPALAVSAATGFNVYYITPIVCGVCIFYTTIGGLKAVVWTDTLQFTVTIGAIITVSTLGIIYAGGFGEVWRINAEGSRLNIFIFDPDLTDRDNFWSLIIGYTFLWISSSNTHQGCVQKYISIPTLKGARLACLFYGIGILLVKATSVLSGLLIYAKYHDCDPFQTGHVKRNDQLLPYYVLDIARNIPGLSGLFIAGVFSTALSTLSANLNSLSGIIYEDFIKKFLPRTVSNKTESNILKVLVVICGTICTLLVYIVEHMGNILPLNISLSGVAAGPLLGLFTLGVLFPKCNTKGAIYGAIAGLLFLLWIVIISFVYKTKGLIRYPTKPVSTAGCAILYNTTQFIVSHARNVTNSTIIDNEKPFYLFRISYYYYPLMGCLVTIIVGVIISKITSSKDDPPVPNELLSPVINYFRKKKDIKIFKEKIAYSSVFEAQRMMNSKDNKE